MLFTRNSSLYRWWPVIQIIYKVSNLSEL